MSDRERERAVRTWVLPVAVILGGIVLLFGQYLLVAVPALILGIGVLVSRWIQLRRPPPTGG
jgi:hypothetical protein